MDELGSEDLKQLVIFYNQKSNDAEFKNSELQLIVNRLRINSASYQAKIRDLQLEIEKMIKTPEPVAVEKSVGKKPKAKA
jgi:hypothetical protein